MGSALCKPRAAGKGEPAACTAKGAYEPLAGDAGPPSTKPVRIDFGALHKRLQARKAEEKRRLDEERDKYAAAAAAEQARQVDARVAEVLAAMAAMDVVELERDMDTKGYWPYFFKDDTTVTQVGCFKWTLEDLMEDLVAFRPSFESKMSEAVHPFRAYAMGGSLSRSRPCVLIKCV